MPALLVRTNDGRVQPVLEQTSMASWQIDRPLAVNRIGLCTKRSLDAALITSREMDRKAHLRQLYCAPDDKVLSISNRDYVLVELKLFPVL